jgi:hypothetical protein
MRVKDCEKCEHCQRRVWSQYYEPNNYHPIGMSHAYAYCTKHQKRVRDVKKCDELTQKEN